MAETPKSRYDKMIAARDLTRKQRISNYKRSGEIQPPTGAVNQTDPRITKNPYTGRDLSPVQQAGMVKQKQMMGDAAFDKSLEDSKGLMERQNTAPLVARPVPTEGEEVATPIPRQAPTGATADRAMITRGGLTPAAPEDEEKRLEDIAIKKAMNRPLTEDDYRTEYQAARKGMQPQPGGTFEDIVSPEQYLDMTPEQQMKYRQAAYMNQAGMQKESMKMMHDLQNEILEKRIQRDEDRLAGLEEGLSPLAQRRLDLMREDIEAQKDPAIAEVREAGLEQQEAIQNQLARRGFGRSSASAEQLRKAGDNVVKQVSAIERDANRQLSNYEISLLDKQDQEIERVRQKLESSQDAKDQAKLMQLQEQQKLTESLMKQNPTNPQSIMKAAQDLQAQRIEVAKLDQKEREMVMKASKENTSLMLEQFGSAYITNMSEEGKRILEQNMRMPQGSLNGVNKTMKEYEMEQEKGQWQQDFLYNAKNDQLNREFKALLQDQEFTNELKKMDIEFEYKKEELELGQQFKTREAQEKYANLSYGALTDVPTGGDGNAFEFQGGTPHPATGEKVVMLNNKIANAYPPGYQKAPGENGYGGQCAYEAQMMTTLENGKRWSIGDKIAVKKKRLAEHVRRGDAFYPGDEEIKVGQTLLTEKSPIYGHAAIVNAIKPDGTLILSEFNAAGKLKFTNNRELRPDHPGIFGVMKTVPNKKYQVNASEIKKVANNVARAGIEDMSALGKLFSKAILSSRQAQGALGVGSELAASSMHQGVLNQAMGQLQGAGYDFGSEAPQQPGMPEQMPAPQQAPQPQMDPQRERIRSGQASEQEIKAMEEGLREAANDPYNPNAAIHRQMLNQLYEDMSVAQQGAGTRMDPADKFKNIQKLVSNYDSLNKSADKLDQAIVFSRNFDPDNADNYDDYQLIMNFAKANDPTSAVMLGEQQAVANAAGTLAQLGATFDHATGQGSMSPATRRQLLDAIESRYTANRDQIDVQLNQIVDAQKQFGYDTEEDARIYARSLFSRPEKPTVYVDPNASPTNKAIYEMQLRNAPASEMIQTIKSMDDGDRQMIEKLEQGGASPDEIFEYLMT